MILSLEAGYNRIGLFGGSFDPPHWGHIRTAQDAADELQLDRLAFLPALQPPHKRDRALSPFNFRQEMLELCLPLDSRFRLCLIEAEADLSGTTLETIGKLREMGFTEDRCHLIWLMGSDSLLDLENWYRPELLLQAIDVAVLPRPGYPLEKAKEIYLKRIKLLRTPLIDISAHEIRSRGLLLPEVVPPEVAQYIVEHKLYKYGIEPH